MFLFSSKKIVKMRAFLTLSLVATKAIAGEATLISVSSSGKQGNKDRIASSISANGRYVAFASEATNLVAGDTNKASDVFVYDRQRKQSPRVSVSTGDTQGNNTSAAFSISADGRFVAFWSGSTNLVAGDTNNASDDFVHDRQTKQTRRVSIATNGEQGNQLSFDPCLSADGRFVTFTSYANNLPPADTNDSTDIFVHDG